jgi:hypothetical protein
MSALRRLRVVVVCLAAAGTLPGTPRSMPTSSGEDSEEKERKAAVIETVAFVEFLRETRNRR